MRKFCPFVHHGFVTSRDIWSGEIPHEKMDRSVDRSTQLWFVIADDNHLKIRVILVTNRRQCLLKQFLYGAPIGRRSR